MNKFKTFTTALKLSAFNFVDFLIMPWYMNSRETLLASLGAPEHMEPQRPVEVSNETHVALAQILEANLSHTVWVARASWSQGWPAEYLIISLFPVNSNGTTIMMVGLRDKDLGEDIDEAIPLYEFFEYFEPAGKIHISDYDA